MSSWIDHAQHFVASRFKDRSALEAAQAACGNRRIRKFLNSWPVESEKAFGKANSLADSLEADGQIVPALVIRFLAFLPGFLGLLAPLQIPNAQRKPLLEAAQAFSGQLAEHPELLPSAGVLHSIRGLGLHDLREYQAARQAYEEALDIFRRLVEKDTATYLPDVAITLYNLGNLLSDVRDFPVARKAYEEALVIRRELAAKNPAAYLPDVATTLNNLGLLLNDLRDFPATRKAYEEALVIRRELAAENPAAYLPDVATILNNFGNLLRGVRDFQAARKAFEDALDIYRRLAEKDPTTYLPDVATTLNNFGNLLHDLRDFQAARKAFEDALDIYRRLADKDPTTYLHYVATTLNNLGTLLRDVRDFPATRKAYEEALVIYRRLAEKDPAAYLPDVAMTLNNLGNLLSDVRDFPTARKAYEEARVIYRRLADKDSTAYQHYVATTLNNLGNLLCAVRDFPAARKIYEEARVIYRQLADKAPAAYLPDVAMTLNNLGNMLSAVHDFPVARKAYEEALVIRCQLADENPAAYLPDVAMTLNNLGLLLKDVRDFPATRKAYEEALVIRRRLADENPAAYLPDVATTLNNFGSLLRDVRDFPAARKAYEESVTLAETAHHIGVLQHLAKVNVASAYQYLLTDAAVSGVAEKAFAYSVAMRDGEARSGIIGQQDLRATQDWLSRQYQRNGTVHKLLVTSSDPENHLVLGLVDGEQCHFVLLESDGWDALFPNQDTREAHLKRRELARELWQSLPETFQEALAPRPDTKQFIAISGDPYWSAFPWELLRFGDGDEDYLGLHHALPRLGPIQAKDLESQLSLAMLGQQGGLTAVLAPFDTGLIPLNGVVAEVASVKRNVESGSGRVVAFAQGTAASDEELERQIDLKPDILYYSGHGTVVQQEELLVLHRDLSASNAMSSTTYFGKEHLLQLAERRGGPLFPQRPLIVLNSCLTGRAREAGGAREDLVSAFLSLGAGAVIATALPIYDAIGKALGEALFDPGVSSATDIASVVVGTRRRLAQGACSNIETPFWGAWCMIHLHGSAKAVLPFNPNSR